MAHTRSISSTLRVVAPQEETHGGNPPQGLEEQG